MPRQLFTNNADSNLAGALSQGGTTLTMAAGTGERFPAPAPGDFFLLTIYEKDVTGNDIRVEVVRVTQRVSDTLTIARDVENMTGQSGGFSYPSSPEKIVFLSLRFTAAGAMNMLQSGSNLSDLADLPTARANLGITASVVPFTPQGGITATTVQAAIVEAFASSQAASPVLTALAGLTYGADRLAYATSASAFATTPLTSFGRSLIDDANAAAARTTLGLGGAAVLNVGTTAGTVMAGDRNFDSAYQPLTPALTALAGVSTVGLIKRTGANTYAAVASGATGESLLGAANAAAARTTLGLGGAAVLNVGTTAGTVMAGDRNFDGDYQPTSAALTALAALSSNGLIKRTGANTYAAVTSTSIGETVLGATDAPALRTAIGLGNVDNVGATALRDRTTHTGVQAISTVSGLQTALDGKAAASHTHSAADLVSGIVPDARLPERLRAYPVVVENADLDSLDQSGFYYANNPVAPPYSVSTNAGYVLVQARTTGSTSHCLQWYTPFNADRTYFRRRQAGVWQPWQEQWHTGNLTTATFATPSTVALRDTGGSLIAQRFLSTYPTPLQSNYDDHAAWFPGMYVTAGLATGPTAGAAVFTARESVSNRAAQIAVTGSTLRVRGAQIENLPAGFSSWATVWSDANMGAGSGLDADTLDGMQPSTAATANTIVQRTSNGSITVQDVVAAGLNTTITQGTRNTDTIFYSSTDNYVRKNTAAGFRASLGLGTVATSNNYNDLTNLPSVIPLAEANAGTASTPRLISATNLRQAILTHSPPMTDAQTLQGASLAQVRDRSTHTGTQAIGTVSGLQDALDGKHPLTTWLSGATTVLESAPASSTELKFLGPVYQIDTDGSRTGTGLQYGLTGLALMQQPTVAGARSALGLATVAATGSYNDLTNRPTIPAALSAMTQAEANTGTATTARAITAAVLHQKILATTPSGLGTNAQGNRYIGTSATPPAGTYADGDIYYQV